MMKTRILIPFLLIFLLPHGLLPAHPFWRPAPHPMQPTEVSRILVQPNPLAGENNRASGNFRIGALPYGTRWVQFDIVPIHLVGDWRFTRFSLREDRRFQHDPHVISGIHGHHRTFPVGNYGGNYYIGDVNRAPGPFWVIVYALP